MSHTLTQPEQLLLLDMPGQPVCLAVKAFINSPHGSLTKLAICSAMCLYGFLCVSLVLTFSLKSNCDLVLMLKHGMRSVLLIRTLLVNSFLQYKLAITTFVVTLWLTNNILPVLISSECYFIKHL